MIKLHLTNGEILSVNEHALAWGQYSDIQIEKNSQMGFSGHMTRSENIDIIEIMSKHIDNYNYILFDNKYIPVKSICYIEGPTAPA